MIQWNRHLLRLCLFKLVMPRPGSKRSLFLTALLIRILDGGFLSIDVLRILIRKILCLESLEFGSVPLALQSSGRLPLSLVNSSNTLDRYTVMIDYQNSPSSVVNGFQKRDEQTMGSLQPRNQVADKRAQQDEERELQTLQWSLAGVILLMILWRLWMIRMITENGRTASTSCRDDQCSVKPTRIFGDVSQRRSSHYICPCLKRHSQHSFHRSHHAQDPHSRIFPSCNEWFRRGGQNCNDGKDDVSLCADGGSNVVSGSGCARVSCG